ncbi:MAG: FkbM family methyltransferase [Micavibrio sp.]
MPTISPRPLGLGLRVILFIVRNTPLSRGKARKYISRFFKSQIDYPVITTFRGVPFILNLDNTNEAKALYGHYNLIELAFLRAATAHENAVFVDLGANAGFYTQNFLAKAQDASKALAIEPNPNMCARIKANYDLLPRTAPANKTELILECCAIGDTIGTVELDLSNGFGCATIVSQKNINTIAVQMDRLDSLLQKHNIEKIDVMKVDVEGYEDRALIPFFRESNPRLFPDNIIIEHTSNDQWAEDLFALLAEKGYEVVRKTRGNLLLTKNKAIAA